MKFIALTACLCTALFSCRQANNTDLTKSLWKIRKVEIWKDNEVAKVIDTGSQFWSFEKKSMIEIFDKHRVQNVLHIKMSTGSIRSYDTSGSLQDEFFIQQLDKECLALSSRKKIMQSAYNIIYYLDRVRDTTAGEIKATF
jgi:hypothetical protein